MGLLSPMECREKICAKVPAPVNVGILVLQRNHPDCFTCTDSKEEILVCFIIIKGFISILITLIPILIVGYIAY